MVFIANLSPRNLRYEIFIAKLVKNRVFILYSFVFKSFFVFSPAVAKNGAGR